MWRIYSDRREDKKKHEVPGQRERGGEKKSVFFVWTCSVAVGAGCIDSNIEERTREREQSKLMENKKEEERERAYDERRDGRTRRRGGGREV